MLMTKPEALTPRQYEIVGAVLEGATNRQIADRLRISEQTVKNQLWKLYAKLGIASRLQLAVWAMQEDAGMGSEIRATRRATQV